METGVRWRYGIWKSWRVHNMGNEIWSVKKNRKKRKKEQLKKTKKKNTGAGSRILCDFSKLYKPSNITVNVDKRWPLQPCIHTRRLEYNKVDIVR